MRLAGLIDEYGTYGIDSIIMATVSALEILAGEPQGELKYLSYRCRKCKSTLPETVDPTRANFRANAKLGTTGKIIGIDFFGAAFTCPKCHTKHPHLPSPLYHKIKDSITRAATFYLSG